jgi:hypothetical protein
MLIGIWLVVGTIATHLIYGSEVVAMHFLQRGLPQPDQSRHHVGSASPLLLLQQSCTGVKLDPLAEAQVN